MKSKILASTCILTLAVADTAFASTVSDDIKQLNQPSQTSFLMRNIDISEDSSLVVDNEELTKLVSQYINKQLTINDLNLLQEKITMLYRKSGYPAATAYLPKQDLTGGIVNIKVLSGKLDTVAVNNNSKIADDILEDKVSAIKVGEAVTRWDIDNLLYDLNSINGIKATGSLTSGTKSGTTSLQVNVEADKSYRGIIYTDNYGSDASGKYRLGMVNSFYNVDGRGSDISIGALISNKDMRDYFIDLSTLVSPYSYKTKVGINVDRSSYELGGKYFALGVNGDYTTYKIYGRTNAYKTMAHALDYNYGFRIRDIHDRIDAVSLFTDKRSYAGYAGISGHDRWKNNIISYDLSTIFGNHISDSVSHAEGSFVKLEGELDYYYLISSRWTFKSHNKFQLASRGLDSSEKLSVGGINGVRAYPSNELSADCGIISQTSFNYQTGVPNLSLGLFLDAASVADKYMGDNTSLFGYGAELNYNKVDDFFIKLCYARRIGIYDNASNDAKANGRFWFIAGKVL